MLLPPISAKGLPGKRLEANLAGIIPRIFMGFVAYDWANLHEKKNIYVNLSQND
jgi:hypothetical protein